MTANISAIVPIRPLSVLLVEDDASDAYLLGNALDNACPGEFSVTHVQSLEEALPFLSSQRFDVALLDLSLPGSSELEAMKGLRNSAPHLPIIVLTGFDDETLALSAMKHGVQDYLVKEQVNGRLIKRAICYAIERKHFEDGLTVLANFDALTGLANRTLFESRLEMALARSRRSGESIAVFFIDLDQFKQVNDRLGHDAGDMLLKQIAARLTGTLRECDTIVRFGGDEFAALLEGMLLPRNCAVVAQKMIDALCQPVSLTMEKRIHTVTVGVSIGIALGAPGIAADALIQHADSAMYRAKAVTGSNYQFYTEHMHKEIAGRLRLEQELTAALQQKESLYLYYQPKWHPVSGRLAGAEALIRWEHPTRGMLAPCEFLPLLQPSLAVAIDNWVLDNVCRDIQSWRNAGLDPVQISIHISACQWKDASTMDALTSALKKASLHTPCLAIEVEEAMVFRYTDYSFDALSQVRDMGIEIHLDNFGKDTSSLKLLAQCPLDAIKIDRTLTSDVDKKGVNALLIRTLVEFAHQLGVKVIAEGVETPEQEATLMAIHCDHIQGTAISKPLPAADFVNWMGLRQSVAS